jgi:MFS transporter, UMF1 family
MAAVQAPGHPVPSDPREEPTNIKEIRGWYSIDWSNSLYATVGIGGFLLLQIQLAALTAAGYPNVCPNVYTNTTFLKTLFNSSLVDSGDVTSAYFLGTDQHLPGWTCPSNVKVPCVNQFCPGLPQTVSDCRETDGTTLFKLSIAGTSTDPTSWATLSLAMSVAFQVFVFIAFASAADYGNNRKRLVVWSGIVGGFFSILCVLIIPKLWWIGMPLTIITNVSFGLSSIGYNAFLPLLVRAKPEVQALKTKLQIQAGIHVPALNDTESSWGEIPAVPSNQPVAALPPAGVVSVAGNTATANNAPPEETLEAMELRIGGELSNKGFAWGYIAGIIGIFLCVPFAFFLSELASYQASMALSGAWWIIFTFLPWKFLKPRPGPPLPRRKEGRNAITALVVESATAQWGVVKGLKSLPVTWKYLVLWALFSDAVYLIGSLGGLFAASEIDWGCLNKGIGVLGVFILVPISAVCANMGYLWVQQKFKIRPKSLLLFSLATATVPPVWGLIGLNPNLSFGLKYGWEMLTVAVIYGTAIGTMQSYSRSTYSALVPKGKEAGLFGLYELTNRGSSFIGPLVVTAIQQATGNIRLGFIFVVINIVLPAIGVWLLDVEKGARDAAAESAAHNRALIEAAKGKGEVELPPTSNPMRPASSKTVAVAVAPGAGAGVAVTAEEPSTTITHLAPPVSAAAVFTAVEHGPTAGASEEEGEVTPPGAVPEGPPLRVSTRNVLAGPVLSFASGNTSADKGFGKELAALSKRNSQT